MMLYKDRKRYNKNGYVVVEFPEHPKAFDTGTGIFGVYEHVLIAEEFVIGRPITENEVVHHLDKIRNNNSPDNLLVLSGPMHGKLHGWMEKNIITPKPEYQERKELGCIRCLSCEKPIDPKFLYCSPECSDFSRRRVERPDKEALQQLLWQKPTTQIAKDFGVSDKAVEKWSKAYEIKKPPRGYWNKVAANALKDL